ncbi:PspA/IM30 family protein [Roseibium aggregatum]|uniref:PspA/IM30 family protein n=1 Tax=Roseibium aggregatum TaxID=187304 RepID=A0A939EEV5_9HYPH|nr:PspA/IM30 family protein [Roseibium aggregatum]MBN9670868.1 PspA/IM30 family protein [Roseibium aggregatum]
MFEPFIAQLRALFDNTPGGTGDPSALPALGWTLRTAAQSVRSAQAALARAKAEQQLDRRRLKKLEASIEDLENRTRNAVLKGAESLAREAAEAIAVLEDEKTELEAAIKSFDEDLAQLTDQLYRAQNRLRALKRGERTAEVREQIQKAQSMGASAGQSALAQAENRLDDILNRQERDRLADREFAALSPADSANAVIEKLAEAGCGKPVRRRADEVLARLKSEMPLLLESNS